MDGCCDHRAIPADEELHRHAVENLAQADALLFGRVTYEMMEAAWRAPARTGARPDWMEPWMEPFARTIDAAKKYVVSSSLERVDWNAQLVRGDLGEAVRQLKQEPGKGLFTGGVTLPLALAELARGLESAGLRVLGSSCFLWVPKTLPDSLLPSGRLAERLAEALPLVNRLGATTLVWTVRE